MYLKRKNCGRIKGRGCDDGRKQRMNTSKTDASSPTLSIKTVCIAALIDAHEGRNVAIVNIAGAYHADMDELVIVRFKSDRDSCSKDPKIYRRYVTMERYGKIVLYVKTLYGCLRSVLLFGGF